MLNHAHSRCKTLRRTSARFPLTPALSPEEREFRIPSSDATEHFRCAIICARVLPLPWGESRGEGEWALLQPHQPAPCRNGQTLRVLQRSRRVTLRTNGRLADRPQPGYLVAGRTFKSTSCSFVPSFKEGTPGPVTRICPWTSRRPKSPLSSSRRTAGRAALS